MRAAQTRGVTQLTGQAAGDVVRPSSMRRIASITFRPRHGPSHEIGALWEDEDGVRLLVSKAIKPLEDARDRRERRAGLLSIRAGLERVDECRQGPATGSGCTRPRTGRRRRRR
jgi:hypothetical protein